MADYQDKIQERLDSVDGMFKAVESQGLSHDILRFALYANQYNKELAQILAKLHQVSDAFGVNLIRGFQGVTEFNQLIDGYRLDMAINAQKAMMAKPESEDKERK